MSRKEIVRKLNNRISKTTSNGPKQHQLRTDGRTNKRKEEPFKEQLKEFYFSRCESLSRQWVHPHFSLFHAPFLITLMTTYHFCRHGPCFWWVPRFESSLLSKESLGQWSNEPRLLLSRSPSAADRSIGSPRDETASEGKSKGKGSNTG